MLEVVSHACFIAGGVLGLVYLKWEETARLFHSFLALILLYAYLGPLTETNRPPRVGG
jgi:hypothetical protein